MRRHPSRPETRYKHLMTYARNHAMRVHRSPIPRAPSRQPGWVDLRVAGAATRDGRTSVFGFCLVHFLHLLTGKRLAWWHLNPIAGVDR
jgi:hypothetical protein